MTLLNIDIKTGCSRFIIVSTVLRRFFIMNSETLPSLPRVIIFGNTDNVQGLEKNSQYRLYVGKNDGVITTLLLSNQIDVITMAKAMLKEFVGTEPVEFKSTAVLLDVYRHRYKPSNDDSLSATFWGNGKSPFPHESEPELEPFFRNDMEEQWEAAIGVNPTLNYPFGGPSDPATAQFYPDFMSE